MAASDIISAAQTYSAQLGTKATEAINEAIQAVEWAHDPSFGTYSAGTLPSHIKSLKFTGFNLQRETIAIPASKPVAPGRLQDISTLNLGTEPANTTVKPTLEFADIDKPSDPETFVTTAPSVFIDNYFPTAPSFIETAGPTIRDRNEPEEIEVSLPSFAGKLPLDTSATPKDLQRQFNAEYGDMSHQLSTLARSYFDEQMTKLSPQYHTQMAAIEAQLTRYLNGGTGLDPLVEEAIYNRGRARNDFEAKRVQDAGFADTAARGFTLPNGALASLLARARQESANNQNKTSNEIIVMQAEMEQKNLQFAVTTSAALRSTVLNATTAYLQNLTQLNGQALDYAKSVISAIVEVYNLEVKAFSAKLEGYKAEAQVYETEMRAALAKIEVYKAEIQALEMLTQVDATKVATYRASIDAQTAKVQWYRAAIDVGVAKASIEKAKVEVFQSQVQAHAAMMQVKSTEWQVYQARINGEVAKATAYESEVKAFESEVRAYQSQVDAKKTELTAIVARNDASTKAYQSEVEGFNAELSANVAEFNAKMDFNRQDVEKFKAEIALAMAETQTESTYWRNTADISIADAKIAQERILGEAKIKGEYLALLAGLHSSNAKIQADLAGSAMSGLTSLAAELKYE